MDGEKVRGLLKRKRLYQWELAAALGISEFTLVRWLRNSPLSEERAKAILQAIERLERSER